MAKPSIFSRDYEKRMKKRKRKILLGIILAICIVVVLFFKFEFQDIDFSNVKSKIQAWVDSDKVEEPQEEVVEEETVKPEPIVPEKKYIDFKLSDTLVVKAEYTEKDGAKKIIAIEPVEGVNYNISPEGERILFQDAMQNLILGNVDGTVNDVTKTEYVSKSGTVFSKESTLSSNPEYVWHSQAKFINQSNIAYVSQLPYFGSSATKKYLWIKNIESGTELVIWKLAGAEIVVGDIDAEKGISVVVDGVNYFVSPEGTVSQ